MSSSTAAIESRCLVHQTATYNDFVPAVQRWSLGGYSLKEAISPEAVSDISHSRIPEGNEGNASSSLKSAAMLGLALSVGASGALVSQSEASASVSVPTNAATTEAFSSGSRVTASQASALESSDFFADEATEQFVSLHTVESGESLWQIAQQHRVGLRELKLANSLPPETSIRVGQVLRVPGIAEAVQQPSANEAGSTQLVANVAANDQISTTAGQRETSSTATNLGAAQVEASETISARQEEPLPAASSAVAAPVAPVQIEIADASSLQAAPASAADPLETAPVATALALPTAAVSTYQVQAGDTISNIAAALGTTSEDLIRINGLTNPNIIFAGTTLTVPPANSTAADSSDSAGQPLGKRVETSVEAAGQRPADGQLAHLQSTANRPSAARILQGQQKPSVENATTASEQTDNSDLPTAAIARAESIDPYVADLLEEVEEVRTQPVQTSEVASSVEIDADDSLLTQAARPVNRSNGMGGAERVALSTTPATDADSELLAAAPISPDAYIPAQRSSTGEIVSPDMPLLPEASEYLPEAPAYFNGYIWPTRGTITSGYGWRWGRMHRGIDVAGPVGTPVVAAAPGVVEQAGWNSGGYGNLVEIRHPDGSLTRYAHNNRLNVRTGQLVSQGQQISEMGSTGYSTGPHLHFEVHPRGSGAVNPMAYLPQR